MSFFAELKRRNIFRVGVAYVIVAWLLIQVASILLPTFQAPAWVMRVFTLFVFLGFPLAIFLAWAYELTPEGIKAASTVGPAQYHTRTTGQQLNYFILALVVLVIAYLVVDHFVLRDGPRSTMVASIGDVAPGVSNSTNVSAPVAAPPKAAPLLRVRRASLMLGDLTPLSGPGLYTIIALSPDGNDLVYVATEAGGRKVYHRALDQLQASVLSNIDFGGALFFSPDGEWVGYVLNLKLYKASILGGPPQQLVEGADFGRGGCWSADGIIYFPRGNKLHRIAATGGEPEPVTIRSELAEGNQSWPWELPGGTHLLFTVSKGGAADGQIALLSLKTGATRILIQNGYNARYVPTGHIVFMRSASLWAVPFDVARLKTTGPEVPVVNGVETETIFGSSVYAFSDDGQLVYLPGADTRGRGGFASSKLVWVDRTGKETLLDTVAQPYAAPRLSPDGRLVALTVGRIGISSDIWTYDLERNTLSRRTFTGNTFVALWTPDGERLVYTFFPDYHGLAWVKADGTGQPEQLIDAPRLLPPTSFSPDGAQLIYQEALTGPVDIHTLSMTGERTERTLLATGFNEGSASLSPDAKWMAYQSNETGRDEIYVRPFPAVEDGKWQISTGGGQEPHWRSDGKELYYRQTDGDKVTIVAVAIETEPRFQAGTPVQLFTGNNLSNQGFDVTADGRKFLLLKAAAATSEDILSRLTSLVIVENWFGELKWLAPPAQ